ncbi:5-oxoprolinase subunit PxpB [Pontibacter cellulosilyticus]|uniref:5-oxoprolinase subunit PxpB n=1 Tax=Pontibacter cellulosilyticus TaxID=1720253 RepID=A0A923N5B4_9BACT|nr:5-oxoprolinase subunit PxpB [Pontibacter cellulosilyticus]MBC5992022.1 5-oxoprolinase subunit PxpB [Pontibacter cellulosilyticus]
MNRKELLPIQLFPLGEKAVLLQFEEEVSEHTHAKIQAVARYLDLHPTPGMIEYVPAYTTLTVYYDPWLLSEKGKIDPYDKIVTMLQEVLSKAKEQKTDKRTPVEIPVCYGGDFGPDLQEVAEYNNLSTENVIELHSKNTYLVHMIGFAPGFPYLGGMDKRIATPRKKEPRTMIPKGSVGIAGEQTGIYPIETPGGWQLIGRTPLVLFDPEREQPSLLKAGDQVKFVPVSEKEFQKQVKQYEH